MASTTRKQKTAKTTARTARTPKAKRAAPKRRTAPKTAKSAVKTAAKAGKTRRAAPPTVTITPPDSKVWRNRISRWKELVLSGMGLALFAVTFSMMAKLSAQYERPSETAGTPEPSAPVTEQVNRANIDLSAQFARATQLELGARIAYWADWLRTDVDAVTALRGIAGAPKIADSAPLVPAQFDCTTYVETVGALARSRTPLDFYANLLQIRYGSATDFMGRNHFPEIDWIPNNVKAGVLRDTTEDTAAQAQIVFQRETKVISKRRWLEKQIARGKVEAGAVDRSVASVDGTSWQRDVEVQFPYLPLENAEAYMSRLPEGSVLNIVHRADSRRPLLVSHQGFVIYRGKVPYFVHAAANDGIKNIPLGSYLKNQAKAETWPVVGVNVNAFRD
ncbi:MAG: N-acetylmuramoyl-L-alanine amidase-like domain-containing protein [Bacteriovoracia bacterium]